jgi:hypothetical protein
VSIPTFLICCFRLVCFPRMALALSFDLHTSSERSHSWTWSRAWLRLHCRFQGLGLVAEGANRDGFVAFTYRLQPTANGVCHMLHLGRCVSQSVGVRDSSSNVVLALSRCYRHLHDRRDCRRHDRSPSTMFPYLTVTADHSFFLPQDTAAVNQVDHPANAASANSTNASSAGHGGVENE